MADTTTTAYGLTKPEVGASEDTWGTKINTDLDSLDTIVNAIGGKTAAGTLSYADSAKLATTSTGVEIKNVASGANAKLNITTESTGGGTSEILFSDNTTGRGRIYYDHGSSPEELHIETTGTDAIVIDNSQNVTIPNGNLDITGTLTADDIILSDANTPTLTLTDTTNTLTTFLQSGNSTAVLGTSTAHDIRFQANSTDAIRIANGGDISFYEDTGTTPKFFWSAADERLGIGTSSPPQLLSLFGTGAGNATMQIEGEGGADPTINFLANNAQHWAIGIDDSDSDKFKISEHSALGTNDYFTVDTSGNVGIGTSSPDSVGTGHPTLDLKGNSASQVDRSGAIYFTRYDGTKGMYIAHSDGANVFAGLSTYPMIFRTDNTERMRIDSSGNVGIGDSSPSEKLNVAGNIMLEGANQYLYLTNVGTGNSGIYVRGITADSTFRSHSTGIFTWEVTGSEKMRLDSSGNLLVGKPSASFSTAGHELRAGAAAIFVRDGNDCLSLNRLNSNGDIAKFAKDGAPVGSIGNFSTNLYIGTPDNALVSFGTNRVYPANNDGSARDNAIDLGNTNARFDDIYATNGTIQTSDRNEKQDIAELTDAEQRVAVAAKGLLRKFRWRDAVEAKGDEARTHFGIIAQDLQAAFAAEGLDAGDYAMFISSTWTDEETGEERTRMGVRYSELLAFIIAAI